MASNDAPGSSTRGLIGRRGSGRGGRLPSLRGPRDLTLGGVQKKTFVPNIPVRPKDRKEDPKDASGSADTSQEKKEWHKHGKGRGGRGGRGRGDRGRGGGRGRGERDVIQSHSIFEQGPAGENLKSRSGKGWGGGLDSADRSSSTNRTGSSIKKEKREPDETKRILDDLLKDDFISDSYSSEDPSLVPVKLPLCEIKTELKKELKSEVKVKEEIKDEDESTPESVSNKSKVSDSPPRPTTAAEVFTNSFYEGQEELIFVQLPDTLPGEPPEKEDIKDKKPVIKSAEEEIMAHSEEEIAKKLGLCSIQDFSEGYIGKIQVRKSGKTTLLLGNVELDVCLGTPSGFLQDAVSIKIDEESKEGDMMVLGHVTNKLVCVPDFDKLMDS